MPTSTSVRVSVGSESESRSQTTPLIQPEDIQRWIDGAGASVVDLALLFPPPLESGRRKTSGELRRRREAAL
ncbi:hypothetical protein GQ602_005270 [Ophiocordyceps camponoti-floridani]|uniref:Uncharacterized protein n=1 Tax=Ophiocordyceps camponoti-floridani TaxID=2030778 RepID=A0A8H4Q5D5_9HYPO|nr:hypothetical protein GQ602_005270 [Ophiocordyceps camponoti-floridani]